MLEFRSTASLKSLPRRRKQERTRSVSTDVWIYNSLNSSSACSGTKLYRTEGRDKSAATGNSIDSSLEHDPKVSFILPGYFPPENLSKCTWKVPADQGRDLFSIIWDNQRECFVYSPELAHTNRQKQLDLQENKNRSASVAFARSAEEWSMLGMAGKTAPDYLFTNPLPHAGTGASATAGIIRSGVGRSLHAAPPALRFEYLGPDPDDPSAFYFTLLDRPGPGGGGPQQFRLACSRIREWRSAAPRFYGPGTEWGGALSAYSNARHSNQPVCWALRRARARPL
jgi:hypothetical protein